jgi:hypothetical protein
MNLKLNYLYRDSSNYKQYGSVVFANPNNIAIKTVEQIVIGNLIDGEYFIAQDWDIPELLFDDTTEGDHQWHEFDSVEATEEPAFSNLFIEQLLDKILLVK